MYVHPESMCAVSCLLGVAVHPDLSTKGLRRLTFMKVGMIGSEVLNRMFLRVPSRNYLPVGGGWRLLTRFVSPSFRSGHCREIAPGLFHLPFLSETTRAYWLDTGLKK